MATEQYGLFQIGPSENGNYDLFAERGWGGLGVAEITRSRMMIISFVAFMQSQWAVADPKSFPPANVASAQCNVANVASALNAV